MVSVYTSWAPKKFVPKFYEQQLSFEQMMNGDLDDDDDQTSKYKYKSKKK